MEIEELEKALRHGARAVIVTTRGHNPGGISLSVSRADQIRALLAQYPGVLVIEDDPFARLSTTAYQRVVAATTQHWAHVRSVAKFLGPDLRVALVDADPDTAGALNARLRSGRPWVSHLLQAMAAHLLADPMTDETLGIARQVYHDRASQLVDALRSHGWETLGPPDGLNVWIDLPAGTSSEAVSSALGTAGWAVQPGSIFSPDATDIRPGIRVTTSTMDEATAAGFALAFDQVIPTDTY